MIHSNLREIVDQRGISIRQVSRDVDYRFDSVRAMYNNTMKHYPQDLISKLCAYLDVGVGELLEHKKDAEVTEMKECKLSFRDFSEINPKVIEIYKDYSILHYDGETGYRVDFGTKRTKLVETIEEAKKLVDFRLSPDK